MRCRPDRHSHLKFRNKSHSSLFLDKVAFTGMLNNALDHSQATHLLPGAHIAQATGQRNGHTNVQAR